MDNYIREMTKDDWAEVENIYIQGIKTNLATFETDAPSCENWFKGRIEGYNFVYVKDSKVVAWAALSPTSARHVYRGVVEYSLYVHNDYKGMGIGKALTEHMIEQSEKGGIWTLESGIMANNIASIKLHEKCGFKTVGIREKMGEDEFGVWRDVVTMERRSKLI